MKGILIITLLLSLFGCSDQNDGYEIHQGTSKGKTMSESSNDWSFRTVRIGDNDWGYQLYEGARMKIDQKNIPAINGLHYFQSEQKAEMAAKLALEKVAQGFFPPTVSPQELDSIGAINLDSLLLVNEQLMEELKEK